MAINGGYEEQWATKTMRGLPRFKNPDNFAYLFSPDSEQQSDYIAGLLFAAIFLLCVFLVWAILLLVFRCLGKNRVGFISGSAFEVSQSSKKPVIVRSIFLLLAILIIIFSALMVTEGLNNLYDTAETLIQSARDVNQVRNNANDALSSMQSLGTTSARNRDLLLKNLETGVCGAVLDLEERTDIDYNQTVSQLIQQLRDVGDFRQEDNLELQSGFNTLGDASVDVDSYAEDIEQDVADWPKFVFPILFGTLCFFLSIGVILAWRGKDIGKYQCFLSWFILPLFTVLIAASLVLAAFIGVGASANADFCSGGEADSPDGTFNEILNLNGYSEDDSVYRIFTFYVDKCKEGDQLVFFLDEYKDDLDALAASLNDFKTSLGNTTIGGLENIFCEEKNSTLILLDTMKDDVEMLLKAAVAIIETLACAQLAPIYTNTFYLGTCTYSIRGVSWTFASLIIISFCGMMMIMFRSAWLVNYEPKGSKNVEAATSLPDEDEVHYDPNPGGRPINLSYHEENETEEDYGFGGVVVVGTVGPAINKYNKELNRGHA